jgi:hypothetical protein
MIGLLVVCMVVNALCLGVHLGVLYVDIQGAQK